MSSLRYTRKRRWVAPVLVAAVALAIFLFVPVSYNVVVGHEVTLDMPATSMDQAQAQTLAEQLGAVLETADVAVRHVASTTGSPDDHYTLTARVTERSRGRVEQASAVFAASLAGQGLEPNVTLEPLLKRVTGNVCMAAANTIIEIQIDTESMSAEDVAAQIRSQLADAGIDDANVEVDFQGDCCKISVQCEATGGEEMEIRCQSGEGDPCVQKAIHVERREGMTDEEVIADVERQLREQGLSGTATMGADGHIRVELGGECQ